MGFKRLLIGGLVSLTLATSINGCKRDEPIKDLIESANSKTAVETKPQGYKDNSCDLYVCKEWIDLNENRRWDKGEFYESDRFLTTDDIEFYTITNQNKDRTNRLSILFPTGEERNLEIKEGKGKCKSHFRLHDSDKIIGQYRAGLYIDDELKQEKFFEVAYPPIPKSVR